MNFFKWFGYLALCAVFIWFVFFRPLNSRGTSHQGETQKETITSESVPDEVPENTIEDFEEELIDTDYVQEEEPTEEYADPEPVEEGAVSNSGINLDNRFLIVVGSFGKPANAKRMLAKVKNNGKDGEIIKIRGLHRVVAASTDNEADAKNLRAHFTHIYKVQSFILEQ